MSATKSPRGRAPVAPKTKNGAPSKKSRPVKAERHVCSEPDCAKVCPTATGLASHRRQVHRVAAPVALIESASQAAERVLASVKITARLAVLAATIRELALALEQCEPPDKAKTSKELTARVAELLADPSHAPDRTDWTEGGKE